ncbi:MAG TPA: hypothetical protein VF647_15395 [Longimicrobium sp.]|jgi:hypothetical protein
MEAEILAREFASRAVPHHGGHLLLTATDAILLINRAAEAGVPVMRVDGLRPGAEGTAPARGETADFSAAAGEGHGCWTEAEEFVRARMEPGLVFELTLGTDPLNAA